MLFFEVFAQAFDSIKSNKMRSFLTMLGVIIGVSSVIMIFSAGNAGKAYINNLFSKLGSNIVNVGLRNASSTIQSDWLSQRDVEVIKKNISEVINTQHLAYGVSKINYLSKSRDANLMGIQPKLLDFRPIELERGRFISEMDIKTRANVGIIDKDAAKQIFGNLNPLGKKIYIKDPTYGALTIKLIGILDMGGGGLGAVFGDYVPINVFMPITTFQSFYNTDKVDKIEVSLKEGADIVAVGDRITRILELTHNNKDKYSITNSQDIQKTVTDVIGVIQIAILFIGGISLVVGGIGIMNIMLVAVTERTREIGIRKAIGAQKKDIIIQFLMEAVLLTGISGFLGIIVGIIPAFILAGIVNASVADLLSPGIILLSIGVSILCGVFFGVYPAKKAADLDPIESLRYE